jgi:hypothetical protein
MRKSSRKVPNEKLPSTILSLFHNKVGTNPDYNRTKLNLVHMNPNIYLIPEFLRQNDLEYFDKVITIKKKSFKASFTENEDKKKWISEDRTSTFFHLSKSQDGDCTRLEQRAADLVGMSVNNVEPMQIVSYTSDQKFDLHHDAGTLEEDGSVTMVLPRRLITFFVYLNDIPEGQGETEFPLIGLKVTPKRGCAVLFCNVNETGEGEPKVVHKANPVHKGLFKYGVNLWVDEKSLPNDYRLAPPTVNIKSIKNFDFACSNLTSATRLTVEYQAINHADVASARTNSPPIGSPRTESPVSRTDSPPIGSPRTESPVSRTESPVSRTDSPPIGSPRTESPMSRTDSPPIGSPRTESPVSRTDSPPIGSPRTESPVSRTDSPPTDSPRSKSPRLESLITACIACAGETTVQCVVADSSVDMRGYDWHQIVQDAEVKGNKAAIILHAPFFASIRKDLRHRRMRDLIKRYYKNESLDKRNERGVPYTKDIDLLVRGDVEEVLTKNNNRISWQKMRSILIEHLTSQHNGILLSLLKIRGGSCAFEYVWARRSIIRWQLSGVHLAGASAEDKAAGVNQSEYCSCIFGRKS